MIIDGFDHRPGVHCGSAALADALRVRGLGISEPMAFGLGAGLGFYCLVSPALSPTHQFQGRCFRFAYQVIERRGTGGGLFGGLYARFLEAAAVPGLAALGLVPRMRALAEGWSRLARALRAASGEPGGLVPPAARELALALARDERCWHEDVAARVR